MQTRIVLIGAGSAMFGLGALGDIFKCKALEGSEIALNDINPDALHEVDSLAQQFIQEHSLPYTVSATTELEEALQGASFCMISIEVGDRHKLWQQDWKMPLQYGIRQVYGENGGPGGLFHSLRIIPPILDICEAINRICPEAYIFNLSNPLPRICLAVQRKFPNLRMVGLCHEVVSLLDHLPAILDTPISNLSITAGGLNHFSVLLKVTYKDTGKDAYPDVREKAPAYFAKLPQRTLFQEILKYFDCLPITVDSHFGEYVHWAHEVADHKGIIDYYNYFSTFGFYQGPPIGRIGEGTRPEEYWRVIPIIEGIVTDSHHTELAVDIPNDGLITNLPKDLVVEVPATVDKDGVHGVKVGKLPKAIAGLMNHQAIVQDMVADAALSGSRHTVMQALLLDPVVDTVRGAEKLLDAMIDLQRPYLDYLK